MQAHNQLANPTHFLKLILNYFKPLKSDKSRADFEISYTVLRVIDPLIRLTYRF